MQIEMAPEKNIKISKKQVQSILKCRKRISKKKKASPNLNLIMNHK